MIILLEIQSESATWSLSTAVGDVLKKKFGSTLSIFHAQHAGLASVSLHNDITTEAASITESFENGHVYLTHGVKRRRDWPTGFCVRLKNSCIYCYPINLLWPKIREPKKAKIIIFHGKPHPWERLVENGVRRGSRRRLRVGLVSWINRYFDQAEERLAQFDGSPNRGSQLHLVRNQDGFSRAAATNGRSEQAPANFVQRATLPAPQNLIGKVSP